MSTYTAPLAEMRFVMNELAGFPEIAKLPGLEEATPEMAEAILNEGARFAEEVIAPLNVVGDTIGCVRNADGSVTMPPGYKEAYRQMCDGGWVGFGASTDYGGQGLPGMLSLPVREAMMSASMGFCMAPLLISSAIEAVQWGASDELKQRYLPKMVTGEWSATMNLTEPQAGSDLALLKSRAEPQADGTYRIFGQKIFISAGEHDMAENIVHLVLARLPDAPPGTKGISLFIVPKRLVNADGSLGAANDVKCLSIEHKMGLHASPTCVMAYGDNGGAIGYLVGQPNRGLECMFVMMNEARIGVALQGVAIGERAYQHALAYAKGRVQGRDALTGDASVPIIRHPDVRRMLMLMRVRTEAARAITYQTVTWLDAAHAHPDAEERKRYLGMAEFLIPIAKGWATEGAVEVASLGVQVHGGMGFIEETGAAQYLRDARITTIYEGTTGIQALDLALRKLVRDQGASAKHLFALVEQVIGELAASSNPALKALAPRLMAAAGAAAKATQWIAGNVVQSPAAVLSGATPYLMLLGTALGGWMQAKAALVAQKNLDAGGPNADLMRTKLQLAAFYCEHVLPHASAYAETVMSGSAAVTALGEDQF